METQRLDAVDAAIKAVRDALGGQTLTASPVEKVFTSTHSTPAAAIPAPRVTLLMTVSQHVHSVGHIQLVFSDISDM